MVRATLLALTISIACVGCTDSDAPQRLDQVPLVLAAGSLALEPAPNDDFSSGVDLARLGLSEVSLVYDLTTPADEPFVFDILTRSDESTGAVRVSIAHALDAGLPPLGGVESLAEVGLIPSAAGTANRGDWLDAHGDGFARVTLRGAIDSDQIIAVEVDNIAGRAAALIRVRIGPDSEINVTSQGGSDYPGVLEEETIYSSDSWMFGLPTIAVSGDRSSIVTYEGDRSDPDRFMRYEMRLQYDHDSKVVTGGASEEAGFDSGNWRDHEIAALFNVLALVRGGVDSVTLKISFDRGATFGQTEVFDERARDYTTRLAQIAMAADYTLAVLYWRGGELVLVEGTPTFSGGPSPTGYDFDPPVVLTALSGDITPIVMGAVYSDGGDLVIGYGFSKFTFNELDLTWTSLTQFRSAVRPYGGGFSDILVEEDFIVGKDPSVAVAGEGAGLRIFYAYESREGAQLRTSDDQGRTWSAPMRLGDMTAHMPSVFARDQEGDTRVDVLYLAAGSEGQELHLRHWDDFDTSQPENFRLTEAKMVETNTLPPDAPVPGIEPGAPLPFTGYRITQVAWFGYDA
ncbi:MAG: hypothetical protein ACYSX0_20710, partial [Planctomycetota bacterium]